MLTSMAQIERAASEQNGWLAIGAVIVAPHGEDSTHGVLVFQHSTPDDYFGTAEFNAEGDGAVGFHWGHYDMSLDEALTDFAKRTEARV